MKTSYKLIIKIRYMVLHFEFNQIRTLDNFIQKFNESLLVDEEDGKEVEMHIEVIATPTDKPVTTNDESEDEE